MSLVFFSSYCTDARFGITRVNIQLQTEVCLSFNYFPPLLRISVGRCQLMSGRLRRRPEPGLRRERVVHVDSSTPARFAAVLRGLSQRAYVAFASDTRHTWASVGC